MIKPPHQNNQEKYSKGAGKMVVVDIFDFLNSMGIKYNYYDIKVIGCNKNNVKNSYRKWCNYGCGICGRKNSKTKIEHWLESKKGFWKNSHDIFVICKKCKDERKRI